MKAKFSFIFKVLKMPIGSYFWYEFESGMDGNASKFELIYLILKNWDKRCCWGVLD